MIYITIIIVAIIIASCVLGYKYIDKKFDPTLYETVDVTNVSRIIRNTLHQCYMYKHATRDEQYKYSINAQDVERIMNDIAYSLNIEILKDYE